ncbi:MAG: hypothetical protein HUU20_00685 [Pirellulales bacterium]|nr:hypothetical protein [Pirellulales bacterium]
MTKVTHLIVLFAVSMALLPVAGRCGAADAARQLLPEYSRLAKGVGRLVVSMETSREAFPEEEPSMAEAIRELYAVAIDLHGIQSEDSQLSYIASQSQRAVAEAIEAFERIERMPKPSAVDVLGGSIISGSLGDPIVGPTVLALDAMKKSEDMMAELKKAVAIWNRLDGIHSGLPCVAQKYSPAVVDQPDRLVLDFDEAWGPVGPHDWLRLENNGQDLADCTILVELTGKSGPARRNVHFVEHWPAHTPLYARYEPGFLLDGEYAGRTTVSKVQQIAVTVWSPKESFRAICTYLGEEKDRDIARYCETLSLHGSYRPFEKGFLWDTQRAAVFSLDGIESLPPCRVTVTFSRGKQSKCWDWELDGWSRGQRKTFQPSRGALPFDAQRIVGEITFPDTGYKHRTSLAVNQ